MKNKLLKKIIALGLLILFACWTIYYVRQHAHEFSSVARVPLSTLLVLVLLFLGMMVSNGLTIKYILSAFGITIQTKEFISLSVVSSLANYLTLFRGGAGLRALYLKARYRLAFSDFLSTLSAMYLVYFLINGMIGLFAMLLLFYENIAFDLPLAVVFALLFCFSSAVMLIHIRLPEFRTFPLRLMARVVNGWNLVRKKKNLLMKLIANNLIFSILIIVQTKVAFANYEVSMSWGSAMFFSAAKCLALLLTITPGSIGIVEWLSVYMGKTLAYSASEALMAQALMRVVTLTTLVIISPFAARYLSNRIHRKKDRDLTDELSKST